MLESKILRSPILRKRVNANVESFVPDLAFEISEQDLSGEAGGGSPIVVTASITVSLVLFSIVSESISAKQGNDWT